MTLNAPKKQPSTQDELLTSGVQVDKIGDVVKQEKKSEIMGKENLDENVDDPPPAVPSRPAKAAKKLPPSPGTGLAQIPRTNLIFGSG